jgi:AGCS family alanine or glycine:cation symporter
MWEKIYNVFDFLWGYPMLFLLVFGGIYYTIRTRFFQVRGLPLVFKKTLGEMFKKDTGKNNEGSMTPLQAISTVLAGTVGSGNIAGVAAAIAIGGPGALFWMWVTAIFGMLTKLAEVSLAVKYREKGPDGEYYGGPMYYIKKGLGKSWHWLAPVFSVALLLLTLCDAAFVQVNTAATALDDVFGVPMIVTGVSIAVVSLIICLGGIKRVGEACSAIVPPMCLLYILGCLFVIFAHIDHVGYAFDLVFKYAFAPAPVVGGFAGAGIKLAMTKGGFRGIFSNEAGEGTAATVHATAKTDHPIHQGLYGVLEVFIDTIIICTLTGIAILSGGEEIWASGETGIYLTFLAFRQSFGNIGMWVAGIAVFLFCYSSYLGYFVEFRTSLKYVFGDKISKWARWLFFIPPVISCTLPVSQIWDMADMVVGFIFIPNMIALLLLSPQVVKMLKEYEVKIKTEKQLKRAD